MAVTAQVADRICGQSQTLEVDGEIVYAIQVQAEGFNSGSGCGSPGRPVTFSIDGRTMLPFPGWDNTRLWEVPVKPAIQIFLPIIRR